MNDTTIIGFAVQIRELLSGLNHDEFYAVLEIAKTLRGVDQLNSISGHSSSEAPQGSSLESH
jgi:hypothetical protein